MENPPLPESGGGFAFEGYNDGMECDHRFLVIGDNRNDDLLVAQIQELHGDEVAVEAIAGIREGLHEVAISKDRGSPYDHVFIDPDLASTIDFKKVLEQLKEFGQEVSVLEPHFPATRSAIAKVPDVTIVPKGGEENFLRDLVLKLAEKKKTTGGTTNQIQIDNARTNAKVEFALEELKELKAAIATGDSRLNAFREQAIAVNIENKASFTDLRNQDAALQSTLLQSLNQIKTDLANLRTEVQQIAAKQKSVEPEKDLAIARITARNQLIGTIAGVIIAAIAAGGTILNAIAPQILQKWLGHHEPIPKISPAKPEK